MDVMAAAAEPEAAGRHILRVELGQPGAPAPRPVLAAAGMPEPRPTMPNVPRRMPKRWIGRAIGKRLGLVPPAR